MKIEKFLDLFSGRIEDFEPDAEILVEGEDGLLHDFTIEDTEEAFDGFDTFYPAGLKIVLRK